MRIPPGDLPADVDPLEIDAGSAIENSLHRLLKDSKSHAQRNGTPRLLRRTHDGTSMQLSIPQARKLLCMLHHYRIEHPAKILELLIIDDHGTEEVVRVVAFRLINKSVKHSPSLKVQFRAPQTVGRLTWK